MKNDIEKIRTDIKKYLDLDNKEGEEDYRLSETDNFYFTAENFRQNDTKRNWVVSKIKIWETGNPTFDFDYISNSEDTIQQSCWMIKDGTEYLFLPEATGGQSVYDTKLKQLHSFYSDEEPFIWLKLCPSPDGNKLAVEGCYWACPNELRIYDISEIAKLPYPLIHQETKFDQNCEIEKWQNNHQLIFCRNKKEEIVITLEK